jgi:N-acetylglutamate synthase
MTSSDLSLVQQAEERLINVWPAPSTMLMDGWVVRFANGYSGRANSASALVPHATLSTDLIDRIEGLYHDASMLPTFRISPLAEDGFEALLLARGYHVKNEASTMLLDLDSFDTRIDERIRMTAAPTADWLKGVSIRQEPSKRSEAHFETIVGNIRLPAAFASLNIQNEPVGFGMSAIDRGWAELGSIMLDQSQRGKGLGRAIVEALLGWAKEKGAHCAFLQVDITNIVAINLYESLGFKETYRYRTLSLS